MVNTGLSMLDVAIGLMVLYLILSLICSSINEGLESLVKNRSRQLERGLREILSDPDGTRIVHLVYNHPLITGLFQGSYDPGQLRGAGGAKVYGKRNLPSYIPAANFALALMDVILPAGPDTPGGCAGTLKAAGAENTRLAAALREAAHRFPAPEVGRALVLLIDASANDLVQVREAIEFWFNTTMDRVSGWYKRRTQILLFAIGIIACAALNLDTLEVARHLAEDPAARNSVILGAQNLSGNGEIASAVNRSASPAAGAPLTTQQMREQISMLGEIGIPVGWKEAPHSLYAWILKCIGLLATALAATLGAPFWFDVLNRFVVIRSTIKPREKSPEEKSKG
jgi:hypothetical protein